MAREAHQAQPSTQPKVSEEPSSALLEHATPAKEVPFWLVNVPRSEWPDECPPFLRDINEKDRGILATPDADCKRLTWEDLERLIGANRLDLLERIPSDLRRYLAFNAQIRADYGSVLNFVLQERLHWTNLEPASSVPFAEPADVKILRNDWPYGIEPHIVHVVVWTKFSFAEDDASGDMTAEARAQIGHWVQQQFVERGGVRPEQVLWFKNWAALKSVQAVEHFHVMLRDVDEETLARLLD